MNPDLRVAMTVEQCWQPVPGGSGTYIARLTEHLAPLPVAVTGLSARHAGPPAPDVAPTLDHLDRSSLPRLPLYESWNRLGLPRAERILQRDVDLVHATTWAVPPTRHPLVVTVHDVAFLEDPSTFTARGVRYFRRSLERVRAEAGLVVVPSPTTFEAGVRAGLPADRMRVVPHGVDMPAVSAEEVAAFRRRMGLERPYILWCGTVEPRKNLTGVVAGFAAARGSLPDHDLVLVGPAGWGSSGVTGSEPRVHLLGRLPQGDLVSAYAGADVFCYPSFTEGFGLPVLEAMAYGVPVVTSTGTPMADLVGDSGRAVDPRDAGAIGSALVGVLADRPALSRSAAARAAQFSWPAAAAATLAVYRELL